MAYGGGTFIFQNKELSGAYINNVSVEQALNTVSDRGTGALPISLDWGTAGKVFEVTNDEFLKETTKFFGYDYTHEKMRGLRDFYKNAKTGYFYRLNGGGVKASNKIATALHEGVRGNDLAITIEADVDEEGLYTVITYLEGRVVDKQKATKPANLEANGFVVFKDIPFEAVVGLALSGGANGKQVTGADHQKALDLLEGVSFNTLGCLSSDELIKNLYIEYTKRQRNEVGKKFQTVVYNPTTPADFEGVISLGDKAYIDDGKEKDEEQKEAESIGGVYWVTGASAGCEVNASNENKVYNGEYKFEVKTTQNELKKAMRKGLFLFHEVDGLFVVAKDINSFISFTTDKNRNFRLNQVIRVLDQVGTDIALTFNKYYLGKSQNDDVGRTSLFNEINDYIKQLRSARAVQNYDENKDLDVEAGREKEGVFVHLEIQPTVAMSKLYMVVAVR